RPIAIAIVAAFLLAAVPAYAQDKPLTFDDGMVPLRGTLVLSRPGTERIFIMKDSDASAVLDVTNKIVQRIDIR
ncbi:MAG: hypothetical protein ACXWNH_19255, partial [Vulcanimicrobiaceae bacterium]